MNGNTAVAIWLVIAVPGMVVLPALLPLWLRERDEGGAA